MPHSKDLGTYPDEFWQLPRAILAQRPMRLEIEFERRGLAISWRGKFNHFKSLLAKQGVEGSLLTLEEFGCLKALAVRIEPTYPPKQEKLHSNEPARLIIEHADETPAARAIRAALESAGLKKPPQESAIVAPQTIESTLSVSVPGVGSASEDAAAKYLNRSTPAQQSASGASTPKLDKCPEHGKEGAPGGYTFLCGCPRSIPE